MRLFIAIKLSEEMTDALANIQKQMYDHGVRGNFTSKENMHLTLAFIGEYPDADVVREALSEVPFAPFDLCLDGVGSFGDLWWAGLKESIPLAAVTRKVRRVLAEYGIPFDRKKSLPHITLIRKMRGEMPGVQMETVSMRVERISLMRSDRGRNGMIYTEFGAI